MSLISSDSSLAPPKQNGSNVWTLFEKTKQSRVCLVCKQTYGPKTATGLLRNHLMQHFGDQTEKILSLGRGQPVSLQISKDKRKVQIFINEDDPLTFDLNDESLTNGASTSGRVEQSRKRKDVPDVGDIEEPEASNNTTKNDDSMIAFAVRHRLDYEQAKAICCDTSRITIKNNETNSDILQYFSVHDHLVGIFMQSNKSAISISVSAIKSASGNVRHILVVHYRGLCSAVSTFLKFVY